MQNINSVPTEVSPYSAFFKRRGKTLAVFLVLIGVVIWQYAQNAQITEAVIASTIRQSTPLVLGALCGLLGERSAVINIGIEGQMLLGAFVGFLANVWTGNLFLSVLAAVLVGAIMGLLLAYMSVTLKMDQIIGGTVINILALGLTGYF